MTTITDQPIGVSLLVRFVLESLLDYADDGDVDGRLACWSKGEGRWAVAWRDRAPAGVACLVTLDDGPYQGERCLYWLEVLPPFQGQGIGQALLAWAIAQTAGNPLVIAATSSAAPFYRRHLAGWTEPIANTFIVKGGIAPACDERIAA
jgi:GNAT superfamily N-acetyltransferase